MPSRIIRESARFSPTLWTLSAEAERMFWRLTTVADDWGRFDADPRVLLAQCFPLGVEELKVRQVQGWYDEMVAVGLIDSYAVNGRRYGAFITWSKYQRARPGRSKFPDPPPEHVLPQVAAKRGKSRQPAGTSGLEKGEEGMEKREVKQEKGGLRQIAATRGKSPQAATAPPTGPDDHLSETLQQAIRAMHSSCFHGLADSTPFTVRFWNAMLDKVEAYPHITIYACLHDVDGFYVRRPEQWPKTLQKAADRMAAAIDTAIGKLLQQHRKVQHA